MAQDASGGIDLASLLASVKTATVNATDTIQKLTTIGGQEQNTYDDMLSAVMSGTDSQGDTVLSKQAKVLGELETQNKKADFYQAIGMNGEGVGKISNELATRYTESLHKALELSDSVKQRKSVGFLDNPLAYLWNQMVLPDEEQALSGAVNDAKLASDGMQAVNQMAQQTAKTEKDYEQSLTVASAQSQVEATSANIRAQADQVRLKAAQSNAQNVQAVMSANAQQLQFLHMGVSAQQSARQLALSEEANSRSAAQFSEWKKQTELTEQATRDSIDYINLGADIAGKPRIDNLKLATVLKTKGAAGLPQEMQALLEIGFNSAGTGKAQLGGTGTSAVQVAQILKLQVPEQISSLYNTATGLVRGEITAGKLDPKNKSAVEAATSQYMAATLAKYGKSVDSRDETNPLLLPSSKTLATSTAVQQTALYRKVLEPEITVGKLATRDVGVILQKGLAAVSAGTLTLNELSSGLDTYVTAGVHANLQQGQFEKFGFTPQVTSYNAQIQVPASVVRKPGDFTPVGGLLSGTTPYTVDLLDKTARDGLLVKLLNAKLRPTPHTLQNY